MQSEVYTADRSIRITRPFAPATRCSFGFSPPFMRPINRPHNRKTRCGSVRLRMPSLVVLGPMADRWLDVDH